MFIYYFYQEKSNPIKKCLISEIKIMWQKKCVCEKYKENITHLI